MCSHLDCFTFKTPIFFPSFFAIFGGDRLETSQERSFSTCFLFFFFFYFRRVAKMKEESELLVVLFCRGEYSLHKGGYKREKDTFFFLWASRDVLSIRGYWDYHEDLGRWEWEFEEKENKRMVLPLTKMLGWWSLC